MKKISMAVVLLFLTASTVFSKDENVINKQKELLIINNNAVLYESESISSKQVRVLNFLEKIYLIKESSGIRVFVVTEKDEKGWVDSVNTSIIPSNWKKIDNFEELSVFIPSNLKYFIEKGKWEKHRMGKKFIESKEDKIYLKNFYVNIYRSDETFDERIEKEKKSGAALYGSINYVGKTFKGEKLFCKNYIGMDFTQGNLIIIPYKENSFIRIGVSPESSDPSTEEIKTALKILFSFEIK